MVRRTAAVAALMAMLTGCSSPAAPHAERQALPAPDSGSPSVDNAPPAEPEDAEPEVSDPAQARAEFRAARRAFLRAGTGRFATVLSMPDGAGGGLGIQHDGSYDLAALRSDYAIVIDSPDGTLGMQVRSSGSNTWYALTDLPGGDRPEADCWIHLDLDVIEDVTEIRLPGGPGLGFPPEVVVVATGKVEGYDPNGMPVGSTDLYTAASVTGGTLARSLGIGPRSRARVPITFLVAGGVLTGWYVEFGDIVAAADDAGHLPADMRGQLEAAGPAVLASRITAEFDDVGETWTYRPPPPARTIEMSADESFESAMRSCTGLGQSGA